MKHTPRTAQMRVGWIDSLIVQTQFDLHSYSSLVLRTRPVHLGIFAFVPFRPQSSLSLSTNQTRESLSVRGTCPLVIEQQSFTTAYYSVGDSLIHTCYLYK